MNKKNNISLIKETECIGCSCCADACPTNAIKIVKDKYGFSHPIIKNDDCIKCGRCLYVCGAYNYDSKEVRYKNQTGYVTININESERISSSSGGIFPLLAHYILNKNGIVYGAAFDSSFNVVHIRGKSLDDIQRMKGSKYVQSDVSGIYNAIEKDLVDNKLVLFTGLPCQCYALKKYLTLTKGAITDNLIICDLICHGVTSPKIWNEYIKWRSKDKKIKNINFRDKRYGSSFYALSILYEDNMNICEKDIRDPYIDIFQNDYAIRTCCTECRFKNKRRFSDITIGDYAGSLLGLDKRFNDEKGKSLIIINSEKGEELFKNVKKSMIFNKIDIDTYVQPNIVEGYKIKANPSFWKDYFSKGFEYVLKKYTEENLVIHLKRETKRYLKSLYIKVIK